MTRYRPDVLGQAILDTMPRKVQRFRLAHAGVLVGLRLALVGAVAA